MPRAEKGARSVGSALAELLPPFHGAIGLTLEQSVTLEEQAPSTGPLADPELERIVREESECLARVQRHLAERRTATASTGERALADYDREMLALRDEIAAARLEDVPPLLEEMERLQHLSRRKRDTVEGYVDPLSPYFGRMVLQEGERRREVLIGRGTYLDTKSAVRIVDWRDAPVSRLYYRCDEGEEYDEVFGEREVTGEVLVRRSVTISEGRLMRISAPQGTFVQSRQHGWLRLEDLSTRLTGGQGSAVRPERHQRPGKLGVGEDLIGGEDKHLKEITPLIDKRQFELITRPDSGLVVIQGGAGSGKTTIGLHRLAYLAYHDKRRFRPDRMLVVVFNEALARYVSQVLPALGLTGVTIRTYEDWAARLRATHLPTLPRRYSDETPTLVTRLKKHPTMLHAIEARVAAEESKLLKAALDAVALDGPEVVRALERSWQGTRDRPVAYRLHALSRWVEEGGKSLSTNARVGIERTVREGLKRADDVVAIWADLLSDRGALGAQFAQHAPGEFTEAQLDRAHKWCAGQAALAMFESEEHIEQGTRQQSLRQRKPKRDAKRDAKQETVDEGDISRSGIDGRDVEEGATLDREDDTLLLRLMQRLRGPLKRGQNNKEALVYEHVLVDEAQDLSPVEMSVVMNTVSRGQSVTLAGDVSQRLHMDNGFRDWKSLLGELGLNHVEVEPLKLSYRSTAEILDFAGSVLGPLAPADPPIATRSGAPVELFPFAHSGEAVAFLSEALRELMHMEPRASVAVISRFPEQADVFYQGLHTGEVPYLRRVADQDFVFRPGVDVTDVRQVKGLEFDYVILVEVSEASYPVDDEARHLLHIAATRAAHQLWVSSSGRPSQLLPEQLRERGY